MKKIKIACFAGSMKPGQDGVTRVLFRLANWLNNNQIENIFISPMIPSGKTESEFRKVPGVSLPFYKEYKFALPGDNNFKKVLNEFKPDIIHINSPCTLGCAAIHYGEKNNIPVAATYHTHFPSYAKYYKMDQFESLGWAYLKNLYNRCDRVFVPSISILKELEQHGFKNLSYLPHGIDLDIFNPSFKSADWKKNLNIENKKVLLYAGRLVWEKDLKTLAGIYQLINPVRNDIKFVLAGDGPIRKELEILMPDALFLGYKTGKELSTIFASSDIFVFPSTTETFGNVVLEAMASGLPPICAREGGAYTSIMDNVNGIVCKPGNVNEFVERIILLLDDEDYVRRLSSNAEEYAKEQSWEKIFKRLYFYYKEIISRKKSDGVKAA